MSVAAAARHALARHPDEETRYQAVAALDPGDAGDRDVLLERLGDPSWRVRSAAVERIAASPEPAGACAALLAVVSTGATVGARDAAATALSRLGPAVVPQLVERLGGDDPDLRQATAAILGVIADRRAVAPLTARLADRDPNVRAAAAEALGKIGGREALEALRAAADSDDPTLRLGAVEALGQLGACVSAEQLERLLADRALRRPAYRLLGACEDAVALPFVLRGLCDPSRSVRDAALGALGRQRARRTASELAPLLAGVRAAAERDPGLADSWAAALGSEEPFVAIGGLAVLGAGGASRHVAAMLRLAEDERTRALAEEAVEALPPGPELRAALADALPSLGQLSRLAALAALARLGSPAALESIVREASDPDAYAQSEAVAALGRIGDARGVEPLAGLLGDDAPAVAGAASSALLRIARASPAARAAVVATLRDRAGASPSAALYRTLGAAGEPEDLEVLRAGLRAEAAARRGAAAAAIASLARRGLVSAAPLPELVAALADPAWPVRAAAARSLAELSRTVPEVREAVCVGALEALRAALRDAEPAVRAAAADALGACGRVELADDLAPLVAGAASPAPVVVAALHALVALGAAPAELVARAAAHPDPEVVKEAVLAAARLPGGEAIVRAAAASPRWDVRQAAARALEVRGDRALAPEAARLAAAEPDPLVARAFADAARALGTR